MEIGRLQVFALLLSAMIVTPAGADDGVDIAYSELLQGVIIERASAGETAKPQSDSAQSIHFQAFSKQFDIRLVPNHALLGSKEFRSLSAGIGVYRGELDNVENSWVRLVIADGKPRGMFWDGHDVYAVETVNGQDSPIIYRLDDLAIAPGALHCSDHGAEHSASELLGVLAGDIASAAVNGPGATSQIEVAVIGDFEFTSAKGASAEADLLARMNNVDGIFSAQLGVQLTIGRIDVYADSNDPFSDSTSSGTILGELSDYRNATSEQNAHGLSHLFTGRNLDGSTVGRAYRPGICSRRFGAGITQGTFNLTTDSLIAAHEIGHNFDAPHDGDSDHACGAEPGGFLMAPSINGSDQFSACSISEMQARVAQASCVTPLPSTDVAILPGSQTASVLLGDTTSVSFAVNSVGTNTADSVTADISIPAAVELNSASTDIGSCSSGAGNVSCDIGSISAGSGATVTLDVTTVATGSASFDAAITAAVDDNSNNNQSNIQFDVDPAVDLVATSAAASQVFLTQSASLDLTVENLSTLESADVELTVTPSSGLQIDGATWAAGSCSVANGTLTCDASTLAAQSSNSVSMQVSGVTEGDFTYTMSVTSNDVDRDPDNNSAMGTVTVPANSPPTISITGPSGGSSFTLGGAVQLSASATDTEDGDVSGNVAWSSSVNGALGSGASLSVTSLSLGDHTITASVSDSSSEDATATTTLTITEQPQTSSGGGGSGGGGAIGLPMLLIFLLASCIGRFRLLRPRACGS